jgi:hypothetical protein
LAAGKAVSKAVEVTHDPIEEPPESRNTGHSLITGVAPEDDDLRNRIALSLSVTDLELAKV